MDTRSGWAGGDVGRVSYEELKRWARRTDLPDPVRWDQVEARILDEPVPGPAELAATFPRRSPLVMVPVFLLVLPEVVLVLGSSLVGLVLVLLHVRADRELPTDLGVLAQGVFLAALVMTAVPVLMWTSTRRRGLGSLALAGGTALASATSFWLLATAPSIYRAGVWGSLQQMAALATVTGKAAFVFLLTVGKPRLRGPLMPRLRRVPPEELWLRGMRAGVLEELRKRGLVNDIDTVDMGSLPPGTWRDLESLPDGRVVWRRDS